MEIRSLMETMKPPFSSTDIIYDEDAGIKPFICPVFCDSYPGVFSVDKCGIILGDEFDYLSPSNKVICLITAFFNYAARCRIPDITTAFDSLNLQYDINDLISEAILDYLHRRKEVQWFDEKVSIDIVDGCEYHALDYDIDELAHTNNSYIDDLLSTLPTVDCYGFSYTYEKLKDLVYVDIPHITFIDVPNNLDVIRGKFIDI